MAFLEIENIRKSYGTQTVVQSFELAVERGEFISFLGPSGCGKTTTLRMVAGFETPSEGAIRINNQEVTYLRPNQRNVGMVFQSYALFPHLTVAENIAFGLKVARRSSEEIRSRVALGRWVEDEINFLEGVFPCMEQRKLPCGKPGYRLSRISRSPAYTGIPDIVLR